MADADVDIDQLTAPQREALQTYTSVTNQELSTAVPLLQRSAWNVQIAIAKFFDGERADPVAEAFAAQAALPTPAQRQTRREAILHEPSVFSRPRPAPRDPAPRIVPQPENRNVYKPPLLLSLLFTPFGLLYRLLSGSLSLFGYLFPALPRLLSSISGRNPARRLQRNTTGRQSLNPRDTAARFIREFDEEYGAHSLQFFENGYAQAYDIAKRDLKFLLVVLISPEHDDTTTFVQETLLSPEVAAFFNNPENQIILWAGNVQDSEAYQVSVALQCTKFPFAALVVQTPQDSTTSMSTIARVSGRLPPSAFIAKLETAISHQLTTLQTIRATRAEQQASRNLRTEQESAYDRSLAQDRERARQRREAEAARLRVEREEKAKAEERERATQNLESWRRWKVQQIPPEPPADMKNATRLSIRLPSGERIIRKFAPTTTIEDLYAFVECQDLLQADSAPTSIAPPPGYKHIYGFILVSPMPRVVYDLSSGSVGEQIGRSGNLIVEPIMHDDGDEEDDE